MPPSIIPIAKSLGFANQKTDLMGIFNAIRPPQYPHLQQHFVIFAQLLGGLGQVPFYFDVCYAADNTLVHSTKARLLYFPNRDTIVQMAFTADCLFPQPGIYLVELICNGQWVADTTLKLH